MAAFTQCGYGVGGHPGPDGYLKQLGLVAAPASVRARSQQAARNLTPVKFAELK